MPFQPATLVVSAASFQLLYLFFAHVMPWAALVGKRFASLSPADRVDWFSRSVSSLHLLPALAGCAYSLLVDPSGRRGLASAWSATFESSPAREHTLMVTAGYLLYDLVLCLRYPSVSTRLTLVHHALIILAFSVSTWAGFGTWYCQMLVLNEASTIFLNVRTFMLFLGRDRTRAYVVNGMCLLLSFFVGRIVVTFGVVVHIAWAWVTLFDEHWKHIDAYRRLLLVILCVLVAVHLLIQLIWFRYICDHAWRGIRRLTTQENKKKE